uniref:Major sperm protein n=1 Tax=Caenorhabditis japonica TaxID=281687 RepID=A0A8R1HU60_CAEJA
MLLEVLFLFISVKLLAVCASKKKDLSAAPSVAPCTPTKTTSELPKEDVKEEEKKEEEKKDEEKKEGGDEKKESKENDSKDKESKEKDSKESKEKDPNEKDKESKEKDKESKEKDSNEKDDADGDKKKKESLVSATPSELRFDTGITSQKKLKVTNLTDKNIMFKIKSTTTSAYLINPVFGKIDPKGSFEVVITHRPSEKRKDKLVVMSHVLTGKEIEMAKTFKQIKASGIDVTVQLASV